MAVDLSAFRMRPVDGRSLAVTPDYSGLTRGIGQGLGALAQGYSQRQAADQKDALRKEAEVYGRALATDDMAERSRIINSAIPDFDSETQLELAQWLDDPIETQNMRASMALQEGGFGNLLESINLQKAAALQQAQKKAESQAKLDEEFRKEERKIANESVKGLKKRASEINQAFGKVENLITEIKNSKAKKDGKAGRATVAATVMNVARLISPGVVTDKDFKSLSGAADPLALAFSTIAGRDENVAQQLQRFVDPTNPELVNEDELLNIARAATASEAPSLMNQLQGAKDRAITAGFDPEKKQYQAMFTGTGVIDDLSRFNQPQKEQVDTLEGAVLMQDANGNYAYVRDGVVVQEGR